MANYKQYYFDLDASNALGIPLWKKLYDFREAYGKRDLSADSLRQLAKELDEDEALFRKHFLYNTNGHKNGEAIQIRDQSLNRVGPSSEKITFP